MIDIAFLIGSSIMGGTFTGIITVATLKTDIKWIIIGYQDVKDRLHKLETR